MSSGQRSATERPHVLILGDDQDLSLFLSEGLTMGGFWISVIASGIQALEVFRLRTFDLVLVDAAMKGMGALEVIRRLRLPGAEDAPRTDIPILVIAGSLDEIDPHEVAEVGANGLLLPPIELEVLIPVLFRTVDEWRHEHPDRPWADQVAQQQEASSS
jgi:CheY-like chemotaxis protein